MKLSTQPSGMTGQPVRVWDRFIRVFHWTLVLGCITAFVSGEFHADEVHQMVGYLLLLLLLVRIYWGFCGSEFARFRSFVFPVGETVAYVRSLRTGHPRYYLGHNPAGALMVFALLILLALLIATGLLTLSVIDFEGPLLFLANSVSDEVSYVIRELHQWLPQLGAGLVALHLLGVLSGSIQHRENLVESMITGNKRWLTAAETGSKEQQ